MRINLYIEGEGENPADVIKNRIEYRTDLQVYSYQIDIKTYQVR